MSVRHAVAILEARDHLLSLSIPVDDQPPPCPERADDPWGIRSEPDLAVYYRERVWPVEVQRDVRMSNLSKWAKSLELFQRLILVTFCTDRLERQCLMLSEARAQCQLPDFPVLLASLEGLGGRVIGNSCPCDPDCGPPPLGFSHAQNEAHLGLLVMRNQIRGLLLFRRCSNINEGEPVNKPGTLSRRVY